MTSYIKFIIQHKIGTVIVSGAADCAWFALSRRISEGFRNFTRNSFANGIWSGEHSSSVDWIFISPGSFGRLYWPTLIYFPSLVAVDAKVIKFTVHMWFINISDAPNHFQQTVISILNETIEKRPSPLASGAQTQTLQSRHLNYSWSCTIRL